MPKVKILVIDDDEGMTELLSLLLAPAQPQMIAAHSGQEGIDLVKKQDPDIVILDLMMPEKSGWDVCKAVREFSQVPILILSAIDTPGLVAQALDVGADDYLIKPVSTSTLMAHLNRLLRRNKTNLTTSTSTACL